MHLLVCPYVVRDNKVAVLLLEKNERGGGVDKGSLSSI